MILRQLCATATLFACASLATAQSLSFTNPEANALTALGATVNYTLGDSVDVRWTTGYARTTLRVRQGPLGDGTFVSKVLAANNTQDETSYSWTAASMDNAALSYQFNFVLVNAEDANCAECTEDSVPFYVNRPTTSSSSTSSASSTASSSTSISSSSPTSSATSASTTPAPIASPTSSGNIAGAAMTVASSSSTSPPLTNDRHHTNLAIPLGVGLGVGIPVLLALLALLAFCCLRRRRKSERAEKQGRDRQTMMSDNSQKPIMLDHRQPFPQHLKQQAFYMPAYRPPGSSGRESRGRESTASNGSYFEPFEFERAGSDQDFETRSVMSEMTGRASRVDGTGRPRLMSIDEDEPALPQRPPSSLFRPGTRPGTPNWPLRS